MKQDVKLYKDLFKKEMKKHTSSAATTTFKISKKDLDGRFLADLKIETPYGTFNIDSTDKIEWILDNVHESQYGPSTCYTYNKAMSEAIPFSKAEDDIDFNSIRQWADTRGIVQKGNDKVQYIKLMEEAGELAVALLKDNDKEIKDAIGDMVVVLTNLASLRGFKIEDCIKHAYNEIADRTGKMINGTFVKDK